MRLFLSLFTSIAAFSFSIAQTKHFYLVVGTYTTGKSEGIYIYKFNTSTADAILMSTVKTENPSYLAVSKNEKFLYTINESNGKRGGKATAYMFNKKEGILTAINQQSVGGNGPCYVTVDKLNKWLFTANYASGNISVLSLKPNGAIDTFKKLYQYTGNSINAQRQKEPHAHTVVLSLDEKKLFATDLGTDKIHQYNFVSNAITSPLEEVADSIITAKPGNGPRHIAFHPTKKIMCVINELSGTIDVFNNIHKQPALLQTISTDTTNSLNKGSADIHYSPDGKFLYVTNRGNDNNIGIFSVDKKAGTLSFIALQPTEGKTPRNFMIDASGKYLFVANQKSDNVVVFKRDMVTGLLTNTNKTIQIPNPSCLKMIQVE